MSCRGYRAYGLAVLLLAAVAMPDARAQKQPRVGVLALERNERLAQLEGGLRAQGLIAGENIRIELRSVDGDLGRLPVLAAELVGLPVDLLVTVGGPTVLRAAQRATATVPIVAAIMNDPVVEGFVESLARPGGNITGQALDEEAVVKQVESLREAVPMLRKMAVIWHATGTNDRVLREVANVARDRGLVLHIQQVHTPSDIPQAVAAARAAGVQALMQMPSPMFYTHRKRVVEALMQHRLPAICESKPMVLEGCLMSYGPNFEAMMRRTAYYVDRILKGAKPADLPVERPREYDFVVNQKTARVLGLPMPRPILLKATEIVE